MSYILDALKRADAQRQRGQVPGLHAQQTLAPALEPQHGTPKRLWPGVIGAALLLGAGATGLWLWRTPGPEPRLAAADPARSRPAAPAPLESVAPPAPASLPASAPAAAQPGAASPPPAAVPPSTLTPAPKTAPPALAVKPLPPPKPKVAPAPKAAAPGASVSATQPPPSAAKAPSAPTASGSIPLLSELPAAIRSQIPAIAINGVVYSPNPGQRMLLVNQQVLSQGSQAVPEVSLEEIGPHSSVFSFRGTRFRLAH